MAFNHRPSGITWAGQEIQQQEFPQQHLFPAFLLEGTTYRVGDTVHVGTQEWPYSIATILRLWEDSTTNEKLMRVRWFCRPGDLPAHLKGVNEDEKEIFISWNDRRHDEVNLQACTLKKCNLLCTWGRSTPTEEEVDACEHFFQRAVDMKDYKMKSLHEVIDCVGFTNVFGREELPQ